MENFGGTAGESGVMAAERLLIDVEFQLCEEWRHYERHEDAGLARRRLAELSLSFVSAEWRLTERRAGDVFVWRETGF